MRGLVVLLHQQGRVKALCYRCATLHLVIRRLSGGKGVHIHRVKAENFRVFGSADNGEHLDLYLNNGLNVLVGENDAGKSSIVDAIRFALLTTTNEYLRIEDGDFHVTGSTRADELTIEIELRGLSKDQQAALLDWLTLEAGTEPYLVVNLKARLRRDNTASRSQMPQVRVCAGRGGTGPELGSAARDLIRATYLKPLRDAVSELRPKKGSRLSQVLRARKDIKNEAINRFDKKNPDAPPNTLVEVMAQAQHRVNQSKAIADVRDRLNDEYLSNLSFDSSPLKSNIQMASELSLSQILERLELVLDPPHGVQEGYACERGLGYNNVLFMAAELLLLGSGLELALLLIEEPEAHLHPQLQARVLEMLSTRAEKDAIQIILSTHSPNIASSASVENLIIVCKGKTFRLVKGETKLEPGDYEFLSRFLDVTKANLFFARGVAMVEGAAEELLLPAIAAACGRSFTKNGISVVNVGTVGLFRYARILQRENGESVPVPVACITDRDIVPDDVGYVLGRLDKEKGNVPLPKGKKQHLNRKTSDFSPEELQERVARKIARARGGLTEVFVSDHWTLEYDLLRSACGFVLFYAIRLAEAEGAKGVLSDADFAKTLQEAVDELDGLELLETKEAIAAIAYEPLYEKQQSKAIVAQYAAKLFGAGVAGEGDALFKQLPAYLQAALEHLVPLKMVQP